MNSENIQLNERLQTTLAALQVERDKRARAERDAIWKDLSFTAAHKLGNPIFAIETHLQVLYALSQPHDITKTELIKNIELSVEKAKFIIEQFKSLTKAQEISLKKNAIAPFIRDSCKVADEKGFHVSIRIPRRCPQVMIDPYRITDCFDELIANALKWCSKPEKKIAVYVSVPRNKIPTELDPSKKYLKILFEDNGTGVGLELKERIFDPFFTTDPDGTGLGLSVAKRIIEGHQGLITENGIPGKGARFEIYLVIANS